MKYDIERQGQEDFFTDLGINYKDGDVLIEHTDGVYNGTLFEFKLDISDINKVLFQGIKYLSKLRITGNNVPKNILLIDLNRSIAYQYDANDFYTEIHEIYTLSASVGNSGFNAKGIKPIKFNYSKENDMQQLVEILKEKEYIEITIDENCIVGWANRYYSELPKAKKSDFLGDNNGQIKQQGEIRHPVHFKGLIKPYTKPTNEKFRYLMGVLNDRLNKKKLGAFYTPKEYCEFAVEMVRKAIKEVPSGNDYIILDRCAGTGNLEAVLTDEELGHVIISTYEYYEYKVLFEMFHDKVKHIIPPTESTAIYKEGLITNANALSKDYIENKTIEQYIKNKKCTIILYENPPYRDDTSGMKNDSTRGHKEKSFVLSEMEADKISKTNEIANRFIYSGFKHYIRQKYDSYILYSPIKYWKLDGICNHVFKEGYVFNRAYFNEKKEISPSATPCIWWGYETNPVDKITLQNVDIEDGKIKFVGKQTVTKCKKEITKLFDKRKFDSDIEDSFFCKTNGLLIQDTKMKGKDNENILGYFVGRGFGISNPNLNFNLLSKTFSDKHGFYLRNDTYKDYLPLLCVKHHLMFCREWFEVELVCCSADSGDKYKKDKVFINKCFFFSMLDYYNKTMSYILSDKTIKTNQLCFDKNTIASKDLKQLKLNKDELEILKIWDRCLELAKKCKNYNKKFTYSHYQIDFDLNTYIKDEDTDKLIYDYPDLNSELNTLKKCLKNYYDKYIKEFMFKYELIK